jgi:deferrochelatase/peroxidase EfeB
MASAAVSDQTGSLSWRLAPDVAAATQGLVASGFARLPEGRALFLHAQRPGRDWLAEMLRLAPVTTAVAPGPQAGPHRAAAFALTWSGLQGLGLSDTVLASFARPFREGMFEPDRARRLGDRHRGQWQGTASPDGPAWSGNPVKPPVIHAPRPYDVQFADDPDEVARTPLTIHALLLLYAETDADADAWAAELRAALAPFGVTAAHTLELELDVQERDRAAQISRDHFGFADGLSQPIPFDAHAVLPGLGYTPDAMRVHGVPLGEILLGFSNAYGEVPPGPVTPQEGERTAMLPAHPEAQGFADLGKHGSYLVVRELHQDVAAFWASMEEAATQLRQADPAQASRFTAGWLAERVVGRSLDGDLLCPAGLRERPGGSARPDNDFLFFKDDPHGLGCPLGSHVRRANPRDGLAPAADEAQTLLAAANNHRILRRGRKYGPSTTQQPGAARRGLLFMCLNTDIARQFEFVQQTWLLNADFAGLRNERDPLVGPAGRMSVQAEPFRHMLHVETFVRLAGGEYFFLPGVHALEHLARP